MAATPEPAPVEDADAALRSDGESSSYPFDEELPLPPLPNAPERPSLSIHPSLGPRTSSRIDEHGEIWCEEHKPIEKPFQVSHTPSTTKKGEK